MIYIQRVLINSRKESMKSLLLLFNFGKENMMTAVRIAHIMKKEIDRTKLWFEIKECNVKELYAILFPV